MHVMWYCFLAQIIPILLSKKKCSGWFPLRFANLDLSQPSCWLALRFCTSNSSRFNRWSIGSMASGPGGAGYRGDLPGDCCFIWNCSKGGPLASQTMVTFELSCCSWFAVGSGTETFSLGRFGRHIPYDHRTRSSMSQRLSEAFEGLLKAFTYAVYCHSPNAIGFIRFIEFSPKFSIHDVVSSNKPHV